MGKGPTLPLRSALVSVRSVAQDAGGVRGSNSGPRIREPGDRELLGEALRPGRPRHSGGFGAWLRSAAIRAQQPADAPGFRD